MGSITRRQEENVSGHLPTKQKKYAHVSTFQSMPLSMITLPGQHMIKYYNQPRFQISFWKLDHSPGLASMAHHWLSIVLGTKVLQVQFLVKAHTQMQVYPQSGCVWEATN